VRVDITYLRQDFSLMMPVANANPWPNLQRFDFLVRTRELTPNQAAEYQEQVTKKSKGELSPYHRAAVDALRELTGRDAGRRRGVAAGAEALGDRQEQSYPSIRCMNRSTLPPCNESPLGRRTLCKKTLES